MILIDREKVLEIFKDIHPLDYNAAAYKEQIKMLPIYNFPTARWITNRNNEGYAEYGICSNCNHRQSAPQYFKKESYKFCPWCGAAMGDHYD